MAKTVFITGSAKGFGRFAAKHFAKKGYNIIIHYKNSEQEAKELFYELQDINIKVLLVSGDLTKEDVVNEVFHKIKNEIGVLDILINNIGDFIYQKLSDISFNDFRKVVESNIYSVFLCSKEALELMNSDSNIINIGCVSCDTIPNREMTMPYYLAKTGVYYLTRSMANEFNVRVNMISPGILENSFAKVDKRVITNFEDVMEKIDYLLSDNAKHLNGYNLVISNGWNPKDEAW